MGFDRSKFYKRSSNMTGLKDWGYDAGADAIGTVNASGYFNTLYNDVEVGDVIRVKSSSGTVFTDCVVITNSYNPVTGAGAVDVADGTTISQANAG